MKKILITGSNGYIAKSIVTALGSKYEFHTINRNIFDLTDQRESDQFFEFIPNEYYDVIIHTAVVGGHRLKDDSDSCLIDNVLMAANIDQRTTKRFIWFGSGVENQINNCSSYAKSKRMINEMFSGIPNCFNLRIYGVFDHNELDTRFIKSNILRYINHEPMQVDCSGLMDFIYMNDLIKLVDHYINESAHNLMPEYDCVYQTSSSFINIANIINGLSDYRVDINEDRDSIKFYYSLKKPTPYNLEFTGLRQGIKETYDKLLHQHVSKRT